MKKAFVYISLAIFGGILGCGALQLGPDVYQLIKSRHEIYGCNFPPMLEADKSPYAQEIINLHSVYQNLESKCGEFPDLTGNLDEALKAYYSRLNEIVQYMIKSGNQFPIDGFTFERDPYNPFSSVYYNLKLSGILSSLTKNGGYDESIYWDLNSKRLEEKTPQWCADYANYLHQVPNFYKKVDLETHMPMIRFCKDAGYLEDLVLVWE